MVKERIYPNYTDLYYYYDDDSVILKRRCLDGVIRFVNCINFDSINEAQEYFKKI